MENLKTSLHKRNFEYTIIFITNHLALVIKKAHTHAHKHIQTQINTNIYYYFIDYVPFEERKKIYAIC